MRDRQTFILESYLTFSSELFAYLRENLPDLKAHEVQDALSEAMAVEYREWEKGTW